MEEKVYEFVIFCMEYYKSKNNLSGKEVYDMFEKYGVIKYLENGYDMLHTEGKDWLINDIEMFIKNRTEV